MQRLHLNRGHSKYAEELLTSMIHDPYADIGGNKMDLIPPSDGKLQSVEEKKQNVSMRGHRCSEPPLYLFSNNSILL